jgi:transcription initiation factor TFIIIB Brf1 subunit/transcription initiation factor TFIIB
MPMVGIKVISDNLWDEIEREQSKELYRRGRNGYNHDMLRALKLSVIVNNSSWEDRLYKSIHEVVRFLGLPSKFKDSAFTKYKAVKDGRIVKSQVVLLASCLYYIARTSGCRILVSKIVEAFKLFGHRVSIKDIHKEMGMHNVFRGIVPIKHEEYFEEIFEEILRLKLLGKDEVNVVRVVTYEISPIIPGTILSGKRPIICALSIIYIASRIVSNKLGSRYKLFQRFSENFGVGYVSVGSHFKQLKKLLGYKPKSIDLDCLASIETVRDEGGKDELIETVRDEGGKDELIETVRDEDLSDNIFLCSLGKNGKEKVKEIDKTILDILRVGPMTAPVMAEKIDRARNTISEAANRLVRQGKLLKIKVRKQKIGNSSPGRAGMRGRPKIFFSLSLPG